MIGQVGGARSAAALAIDRILESNRVANRVCRKEELQLDARDRKLMHQLSLGSIRWLRRLDHIIESASSRSLDQIEKVLRSPLRIAVYEMIFLDRIPGYASVNEAVDEARRRTHRRGGAFVNAVLRKISRRREIAAWPIKERDPVRRLAIEWSHPDFLVSKWIDVYGMKATRHLLEVNNTPKPIHLLTFEDRGGRELARQALEKEGVSTDLSTLAPNGLIVRDGEPFSTEVFRKGDLYVQDEVSQATALVSPPAFGEKVLDLAAAPGGKTFSMLASEPQIRSICADYSLLRIATMIENQHRLGRSFPIVAVDATRPAFRSGFDRVVVDLPCSGTGTLRKHPELKWRVDPSEIRRLSKQGLRFLRGAADLPRLGGRLIVITCSLEEEESVGVVESFLKESSEYQLADLQENELGHLSDSVEGLGFVRVLPAGDHDGFTLHVLERRQAA